MNMLPFLLPAGFQALLLLRLFATGLFRRYPAFTAWVAFLAMSTLVLMAYPSRQGTGYRNAWIASQAIGMIALFGALTELTNRILEHYPGLRRVTTSGLFGLLLATAIVAAAGESFDKPGRLFVMMQSGWNAATGAYVVALVSLATYLDPRRRMNIIVHERVFAAHCAVSAGILLFAAMNYSQKEITTWIGATAGVIFPLMWMRMSAAGEVDRRPPPVESALAPSFAETQAKLERLERLVTRSGG